MPRHLDLFTINGLKANENDFGSMKFDENDDSAVGCYMKFVRKVSTLEVLSKYAIQKLNTMKYATFFRTNCLRAIAVCVSRGNKGEQQTPHYSNKVHHRKIFVIELSLWRYHLQYPRNWNIPSPILMRKSKVFMWRRH